ncbi:flagellar basal body P-ring formation chaperone FlgA [Moellerella wisconsensis]|uniref:Flagella basal body P-ring formation protein FlgA n=1 Tax=Moellerella wisconsensis TaxID=158849 RepID=A0A9Q8V4B3_9GAMM|nr:flagellar basal body P-ring formation chaperone FlgA [Moellerella wisconsensis]UNH28333.1 flagellar basal body P-ring formation chaperone FlgA [Moellerella wisconsensis]UNH31820.1 flagellar basal body P-ring formation chaperone FlgA [Moellerella wisconsensis]UNH43493.1 flagellar basal body P-ring formation chaperone FlgA [Moellerella wisconsensis]
MIKLVSFCLLVLTTDIYAQEYVLNSDYLKNNSLKDLATEYFEQLNLAQDSVKVHINNSQGFPNHCDRFFIERTFYKIPWGKLTLPVRCNEKKYYLQIEVQVTGGYWVTKQKVAKNSVLKITMLTKKRGLINRLPSGVIRQKSAWDGQVSLYSLPQDSPITHTMLRKPWLIQAGQTITVSTSGQQFQINATGQALNNATTGQSVRVRMNNGRIITAIASHQGMATILSLLD